nr:MAG TPA: Transcription initiation factor IIE, alpha FINGER, Transcription [Caudoviricetes sp.]
MEPVRHGRWKIRRKSDWPEWTIRIVCSSCGLITGQKSKYCPSCGAKMDLEDDNGT